MLVVTGQVDVNTDIVHNLNVDLFEAISQAILIDVLLHGVKIESESLIFSDNRTPQVEQLTERILLEASQRDSLLVHLLNVLMHPLAVV